MPLIIHAHKWAPLLQAGPETTGRPKTCTLTNFVHCCRLVRLPGDVSLAQQKVTSYGEDEQWEVQAIVAEATDLSGDAIFLVKWKVGGSLTNLHSPR